MSAQLDVLKKPVNVVGHFSDMFFIVLRLEKKFLVENGDLAGFLHDLTVTSVREAFKSTQLGGRQETELAGS